MALPWPEHWNSVREEDREAMSEILSRLLAHGVLLGSEGRERNLYLLARDDLEPLLLGFFAPLGLDLVFDSDAPILQLRPVDGSCALSGRFNKAETLVLLTLWRIYHDARMERAETGVFITVKDLWDTLKVHFEHIQPPNETQLRQILQRLRHHRLIRTRKSDESDAFEDHSIEILPTLPRVIPFDDIAAWEDQSALYQQEAQPNETTDDGGVSE